MRARTYDKLGITLSKHSHGKIRRRSVVHRDSNDSPVRACEEDRNPGGRIRPPQHDPVAFADSPRIQLTSYRIRHLGNFFICPANGAIPAALGKSLLVAQEFKVLYVVCDRLP